MEDRLALVKVDELSRELNNPDVAQIVTCDEIRKR
jgi:hypothetical protein